MAVDASVLSFLYDGSYYIGLHILYCWQSPLLAGILYYHNHPLHDNVFIV